MSEAKIGEPNPSEANIPQPDPRDWPALPLRDWQETYAALHLRTQMLGKTRLALSPPENHWWHSALYLTARGLTTSPMPHGGRTVAVELDFVDHLAGWVTGVPMLVVATARPDQMPGMPMVGNTKAILNHSSSCRISGVPRNSHV